MKPVMELWFNEFSGKLATAYKFKDCDGTGRVIGWPNSDGKILHVRVWCRKFLAEHHWVKIGNV